MAVYTIEKLPEPAGERLRRKVNCFSDCEALELAQKMADARLSLQVWRGDELLGSTIAVQNGTTTEDV